MKHTLYRIKTAAPGNSVRKTSFYDTAEEAWSCVGSIAANIAVNHSRKNSGKPPSKIVIGDTAHYLEKVEAMSE